jgi:hypothetical protein
MIASPRLGKQARRIDPRTFKLEKYLPSGLPQPPAEVSWVTKVAVWPMYLNDQLGDCVIAAEAHMVNQWSRYAGGREVLVSDQDVLQAYERVGGYVPGDPSTDNGCVMLDALNDWRKNGVGGHKIVGYVQVDPANITQVFQAIQIFGNLFTGVQLPLSAQGESAWTVIDGGPVNDGSPGSWGGHCIPIDAASPFSRTCITWGDRLKMSPNFFFDYVDECYAVLSQEWISAGGFSPSHFDLAQLQADLAAL